MTLQLFAHPFSSYCWKVLIALYENETAFTYRPLGPEHPESSAELARLWPPGKFPLLVDDGQPVAESSIIIEHLQLRHPGPVRLIPDGPEAALPVRAMDRIFDTQVMSQMQAIVAEHLPFITQVPDPARIARAREVLEKAYGWLDERVGKQAWVAGDAFTMADCAAAPALFYADWTHPIADEFATLKAYRARLLARPSVARCIDEARPYRHLFPLGAPDRD